MLSASVLRGPDGAARYYIAQIEDITERKRADEALRLSEAKFSGIVSIAADAIISVDEEQRITIFNEGAGSDLRLREAGSDRNCRSTGSFPNAFARSMTSTSPTSPPARRPPARWANDGRSLVFARTARSFPPRRRSPRVAVGGATFFSVVLRDVTYRKTRGGGAPARRGRARRRARHRRPRSEEPAQHDHDAGGAPRASRAGARTSRSDAAAGHLALSQPDESPDSGPARRGRRRSGTAARSSENDSRPADLVRDAVEAQAPLASSSGLELRLEVGRDVHDVWGDRNRLLQVFDNLIGNAIKFTEKGGRITVGAAAKGQGGRVLGCRHRLGHRA